MKAELYRSKRGDLFFYLETPAGRDLTETTFEEAEEWLERNGYSSALLGAAPMDDLRGMNIKLTNSALLKLDISPYPRSETIAKLVDEYL